MRVPAKRGYLRIMLEALVAVNVLELRRAGPGLPTLYNAGIRYKREERDPRTGKRLEEWLTAAEVYQRRSGDCEDLAALRVAELRLRGVKARIWLRHVSAHLWHVLVRLPDGSFEDPSARLGMKGAA